MHITVFSTVRFLAQFLRHIVIETKKHHGLRSHTFVDRVLPKLHDNMRMVCPVGLLEAATAPC